MSASQAASTIPELDIDLFSEEALLNPVPNYEVIRETAPVTRLTALGVWCIGRYAEVRSVLENHQVFISGAGVGLADIRTGEAIRPPSLLLESDPPEHTRNRAIVSAVLSPRAIRELRDQFTREAEILVERVVRAEEVEVVGSLAEAFPLKVFGDAVGIPPDNRRMLLAYGDMLFNAVGPRNAIFSRSAENADEIVQWITHRCSRAQLADDGLGAQIYEIAAENDLTENQAGLLVRSFLSAGIDTTVHAISNAVHLFAKHPDQWKKLREHPDLVRKAIDEVLRLESPFQMFFRTAAADTEIAGAPISAGDKIMLSIGAANRDSRQWSDAENFDIGRFPSGHVGFGAGIHGCVGQMIARL